MLTSGNTKPETCAANLLKITRYEVPYERIKGLPAHMIDKPADEASVLFVEAATWNLETYEPRLSRSAVVTMSNANTSEASVMIEIRRKAEGA